MIATSRDKFEPKSGPDHDDVLLLWNTYGMTVQYSTQYTKVLRGGKPKCVRPTKKTP